jgi:hypothetical protein
MSTTYIDFKSKGFWIQEAFMEVLCDFICEVFEANGVKSFSENLQDFYAYCDANRSGASAGMVGILLDETITNETDRVVLTDLLNQAEILIASKGDELSVAVLNDFESKKVDDYFKISWVYPIKTKSLIATLDIIIQMLNGTWTSNNYGVYYAGYPNPTGEPEI